MLRWALAGLAVFSVGMATGGWVHHQLTLPTTPAPRPPERSAASTLPAKVAPAQNTANAKPDIAPTRTVAASPEHVGGSRARALAGTSRPSAGEVIITAVQPGRQAKVEWTKPVQRAEVKIAHVRTTSPNLRNNPIVQRELTRDIQHELYRVGCYSVVATGKWDARTVRASAKFVANRNAVLPADRPDVILLSLLRGYQGGNCGKSQEVANTAPSLIAPRAPSPSATVRRSAAVSPRAVGPIAAPVVRRPVRTVAKRVTPRRNGEPAARARRTKSRSWRHKIHYGTGSDW